MTEFGEIIERMHGLAQEWTEQYAAFKQDRNRIWDSETNLAQLIDLRTQLISNIQPETINIPACQAAIACMETLDRLFNDLLLTLQTERIKGLVRKVTKE